LKTFLTLFFSATFISFVVTPLLRRLCQKRGWVDEPQRDGRRVHRQAVPRLGGVAIYAAVVAPIIALLLSHGAVVQRLAAPQRMQALTVLLPATLVLLCGIYDDLRGASPRMKFLAQGLCAAIFYALGGRIGMLFVPGFGVIELPLIVGFVVTLVWVVGITNAFNLIDGMDGLATGAALFAAIVMLIVALSFDNILASIVLLALVGALIGFLRYNFNPASIFLGDSGSLFVGFLLATLSVLGSQKASTAVAVAVPLMAFALPVIDTGFAMARRFVSGHPIFEADREHIHHKLLERGLSQRQAALILYVACAVFGVTALLFANDTSNGRITGLLFIIVGVAIVVAVGRLRYHEIEEARAGMRRNLVERKARIAKHIQIRRASHALAAAQTPDEFFEAVAKMLECGEFAYARMKLDGARGGTILWEWTRDEFAASEIIGSPLFWTLRLPLAYEQSDNEGYFNLYRRCDYQPILLDVNYLCGMFQREMARAAQRVFARATPSSNGTPTKIAAVSNSHQ
jgi:UDP-GlcNAc:undecaprenyl-phosphate GlcNAc-1-phosphate transferase